MIFDNYIVTLSKNWLASCMIRFLTPMDVLGLKKHLHKGENICGSYFVKNDSRY